jgi:tetratricopeptide (TPR) repeat protein
MKPKGPPLIPVCFLGLFLLTAAASALAFFSFYPGWSAPGRESGESDPFRRGLREYDALFSRVQPASDPGLFIRTLDRLEKNSMGVENRLSLLKRRRHLARLDGQFLASYREKALESAGAFPYSESLAAVAAESLLLGEEAPDEKALPRLKELASRIRGAALSPLALGIYVLCGDLEDISRAVAVPGLDELLAAALSQSPGAIPPRSLEGLSIDTALLKILKNDAPGAAAYINSLLLSPGAGRAELIRLGAEFFDAYGNPLRAAELFSTLPGESSLAMSAGALWLAGLGESARNIWTVLAAGGNTSSDPAIRRRSLYNMAAAAVETGEKTAFLESLLAEARQDKPWYEDPAGAEAAYIYGLIRYTRLLSAPRALAILETGGLGSHPLLDLELRRRRGETLGLDRNIAETWLLLDRHEESEELYQWAAWYFDCQRQYQELGILIKSLEQKAAKGGSFTGPWLELHRALGMMRENRLEEAVETLKTLAADPAAAKLWQIPANLARIMEARRSHQAALEYYELAAARAGSREAASAIQYRISRCMRALGQERESRRVLEYALDLNPDNLNARLELSRLDSRQVF